jgi:hypothetical protein
MNKENIIVAGSIAAMFSGGVLLGSLVGLLKLRESRKARVDALRQIAQLPRTKTRRSKVQDINRQVAGLY